MRLSKAASFLLCQSPLSLSPLIRSSNAAAATTRTLTLTALPKRTGKPTFEEEEILLQDNNNNNNNESHVSNKNNFFYPVSPGDVVAEGKYSMIAKLGWGRNSTVWLAEERGREKGRWRYVLSFFLFFLSWAVLWELSINRAHALLVIGY